MTPYRTHGGGSSDEVDVWDVAVIEMLPHFSSSQCHLVVSLILIHTHKYSQH